MSSKKKEENHSRKRWLLYGVTAAFLLAAAFVAKKQKIVFWASAAQLSVPTSSKDVPPLTDSLQQYPPATAPKPPASGTMLPSPDPATTSTTNNASGGTETGTVPSVPVSYPTAIPAAGDGAVTVPKDATTVYTQTDLLEAEDVGEGQTQLPVPVKIASTFWTKTDMDKKEVTLFVRASSLDKVEFFVSKKGSAVRMYLGTAKNLGGGTWALVVDAERQLPNGEYILYAEGSLAGNAYGLGQTSLTVALASFPAKSSETKKSEDKIDPNKDSDEDGISDAEELRIGTDPFNPDTDRDGYRDGDEILKGFDPKKFSPGDQSDKIVFESPKEKTEVRDKRYRVESVEKVQKESSEALRMTGTALPNSFVTLYIFSNPIVVTVKTDERGGWVYELEKSLEEGEHEVYVAVTDNTGAVTSSSEPLRFIKTAQAVTVIPQTQARLVPQNMSPVQRSRSALVAFGMGIVGIFLVVTLVLIGALTYNKSNRNEGIR